MLFQMMKKITRLFHLTLPMGRDCSTEDTKGRYYSMLLTAEGICAFAGSLASGFIMDIWLRISGVNYNSPSFNTILFGMLMIITTLRLISGSLHKFIYPNPLDYGLESLFD